MIVLWLGIKFKIFIEFLVGFLIYIKHIFEVHYTSCEVIPCCVMECEFYIRQDQDVSWIRVVDWLQLLNVDVHPLN